MAFCIPPLELKKQRRLPSSVLYIYWAVLKLEYDRPSLNAFTYGNLLSCEEMLTIFYHALLNSSSMTTEMGVPALA